MIEREPFEKIIVGGGGKLIVPREDFAMTQKFYSGTKAAQAAAAEVYE
jgi:hypothetical protein